MAVAGVAVLMAAGPWIFTHQRVIRSAVTVTIGIDTVFVDRVIGWVSLACFFPPIGHLNIIDTVVVERLKIIIGIN